MGLDFEHPDGATPIDANEAEGLIPSLSTQKELNEFEALNILEGAAWARRSTLIKRSLLDQGNLRLLHKRMFGSTWRWAGKYRLTQKSLGCEAWRISIELKSFIDDLRYWLEYKTYSHEEIAARCHHRLVWIHPFPNGNGRFARLATELLCEQNGWPSPSWGASDLTSASEARQRYISALQAADRHDHLPLVDFMFST
jgi:Fic-DOC domain mobile mystery protein B